MTLNAEPPARASRSTTWSRPMTPKNAFGSMPCADVKSVPVFLSDRMAAAMPWYAATQDTREKTAKTMMSVRFCTDACGGAH
jgi:hypothetical protein